MRTKEDFIKLLHENPLFQHAMNSAKTDDDRRKIAAIVEGFVGNFASVLSPMIKEAQDNPEYAAQIQQLLMKGDQVITGSEG